MRTLLALTIALAIHASPEGEERRSSTRMGRGLAPSSRLEIARPGSESMWLPRRARQACSLSAL